MKTEELPGLSLLHNHDIPRTGVSVRVLLVTVVRSPDVCDLRETQRSFTLILFRVFLQLHYLWVRERAEFFQAFNQSRDSYCGWVRAVDAISG